MGHIPGRRLTRLDEPPAAAPEAERPARPSRRDRRPTRAGGTGLWGVFAAPGTAWLVAFFAVPFYAIAAVAFGYTDPVFGSPVPEWDPRYWDFAGFLDVLRRSVAGDMRPVFLRTFVYVALALVVCFIVGYPIAYYLARYAGRRRGLLLALILAPWWINYITRMLAWLSLLQDDGYVNDVLLALRIVPDPVQWLSGNPYTVVIALVYGYLPFFIVPLYATLDRIDTRLLDASRDLGVGGVRTFLQPQRPDDRDRRHRAADVRRLLHQHTGVRIAHHDDDRQPDRVLPSQRIAEGSRCLAGADPLHDPARVDDVLPHLVAAGEPGGVMSREMS
jgi:ABC-type spermidine/putrescine transport system permease subunit I